MRTEEETTRLIAASFCLQGLLSGAVLTTDQAETNAAVKAVRMADKLIAELNKDRG